MQEENIQLVTVLREARDVQGKSMATPGREEEDDDCNNNAFNASDQAFL